MELTKINNDVNGNPRYVVHFLNLLTDEEMESLPFDMKYPTAVKRANKIGGRKYHTKSYGGGIVFQSYNTDQLKRDINNLLNE